LLPDYTGGWYLSIAVAAEYRIGMTRGKDQATPLRIHRSLPAVRDVLGPGVRAVVWVQGCSLACKGCMVPETWARQRGTEIMPADLAAMLLTRADVEGVTVSGGEPTEQAAAVAQLLAAFKRAGKNTWLYSGYTLEELVARDDPATDLLLSLVDVLVDGRYEVEQAGSFRWRGSANQRIIPLTDAIPLRADNWSESSGVEITLDEHSALVVVGVPPPDFLTKFKAALEARGLAVHNEFAWK
jgi:anaerobic ribonucleoside-triphosphate reductase activating protein